MLHCKRIELLLGVQCVLVLTMMLGCRGKPQETFPVSGVVQWNDGTPATELAGSTIELKLIEGTALRVSPHGEVQSDGTFTLGSYEPKDGSPPGKYLAMITPVLLADAGTTTSASILDARFQRFTTSPLQVTIAPEPNHLVLPVERAKKR